MSILFSFEKKQRILNLQQLFVEGYDILKGVFSSEMTEDMVNKIIPYCHTKLLSKVVQFCLCFRKIIESSF